MIAKLKQNWSLISISVATVILAIIAIITATKLYQIGKEPVAPTAPKPAPAREPAQACRLTFTVGGPTGTPTPTGTSTPTPTGTPRISPTPTPTPRLTSTPSPTSTPGPTSTPEPGPTSTPQPTSTATPTPITLPPAGFTLPTLGVVGGGILLIITALLFAI